VEDVLLHSTPKGGKVAAFFAESIQGVGGIVQFPKDFVKRAAEKVRAGGGLYVADEVLFLREIGLFTWLGYRDIFKVQTGFGRTGSNYWGFQNHGVIPDIVTMAKSIGNGFPMAAVVTTPEIANAFYQAVWCFNTYPLNSCNNNQ
jgi:alanine-glyoxylate transaminase/(R)-3-amino-2-methylpropionate-pyruvate transaminase